MLPSALQARRPIAAGTLALLCACGGEPRTGTEASLDVDLPGIEIEYIAHASFLMRAGDGTELLIDPFASQDWLGYDWPDGIDPDAVLVTHPHYDHDAGRFREMPFPWAPEMLVIDAPGTHTIGDFTVTGIAGKHADPYGMEFGQLNTIMVVEVAGLRIVHLGDNGPLTDEMVEGLGRVDVLMMPADADYHILSEEETQAVLDVLQPRIVIPMHYRIPDLEADEDSPSGLGDLAPWLAGRAGVEGVGGHMTMLRAGELPADRTILVFEHAPYVTRPEGS